MDPTTILLSALSFCASGMAGTVWYVIRRQDARQEADRLERDRLFEEERKAREAAAAKDRELFVGMYERAQAAAREDRHDFRDAIATLAADLQRYKLEATKEYVNNAALDKSLDPMKDAVARIEQAIGKIFDELKGKADKP